MSFSSSTYGRTRPTSGSKYVSTSSTYGRSNDFTSTYSSSYKPSYTLRSSSRDIDRPASRDRSYLSSNYPLSSSLSNLKLDSDSKYSATNILGSSASSNYGSLKRRASRPLPPIDTISESRYSSTTSITPRASAGYSYKSHYDSRSPTREYGASSRSSRSARDSSLSRATTGSGGNKQGGLRNIGNSCYLNSVLQCILHCDALQNYLVKGRYKSDLNSRSKTRGAVAESSADLFETLLSGQTGSPNSVKNAVSKASGLFRGTAQEDAQEFLRWYLEALHEDVSRVITKPRITVEAKSAAQAWSQYTSRENSAIVELCVGQLKSSLTCSNCGYVSEVWDPFWDLSVPIPRSARNIKDCLNEFEREEVLDGSEKPKCEKCKTRRRMTKKFSVEKWPKVLVIHLKRFGDSIGFSRSKITTDIKFPTTLPTSSGSYTLQAVCNHSGGVGGGHYTAYASTNSGWFEYNDSRVSSLSDSSVQSRDAYLLFYTR